LPPPPTKLYSAPISCRKNKTGHWMDDILSIKTGESCPVNNYLHSGFLALQMITDITKIKVSPSF
jgi:ATP-binding cassette, subfamily A (ABC1), member 5